MIKKLLSFIYLKYIKRIGVRYGIYAPFNKLNIICGKDCKLNRPLLTGNIKLGKEVLIDDNSNLRGFISIDDFTAINKNVEIMGNVKIGKYCAFARNITIQSDNHDYNRLALQHRFYKRIFEQEPHKLSNTIIIENDVWIGTKALILGGINIGNGAIIAAGSVVTKNIPPYAIVAGVPAKVIKYRFSEEKIAILENLKWWDWSKEKIMQNRILFDTDISNVSYEELSNIIKVCK
jgi:virginiamycin A acetyltransferase